MAIVSAREAGTPSRRASEWDPFQTMRELMGWSPYQELMPRRWWSGDEALAFVPAFDVRESGDSYLFKADMPGFRQEDLDINITGDRLTVSSKREAEESEDGDTYYCCERAYGSFTRSFTLPRDIRADQIQAELKNGVLSLRVPKSPEAQPKRIELKGESSGQGKRVGQGSSGQGSQR